MDNNNNKRKKSELINYIIEKTDDMNQQEIMCKYKDSDFSELSAVLFLLSQVYDKRKKANTPYLILNKRSKMVIQPGDLCFPGGRTNPKIDSIVGKILQIPGFHLWSWPNMGNFCNQHPQGAKSLGILLATGLREAFEEMRLNPFCVKFLGPLPPISLAVTNRIIYPMAAWVSFQKTFYPNWEVEKIVRIPLYDLMNPFNYARYRLEGTSSFKKVFSGRVEDFPCYIHKEDNGTEILWGMSYRIVESFLKNVFNFRPPDINLVPVVYGKLDDNYLSGKNALRQRKKNE